MRRRRSRGQSQGFEPINATPLIDVVMCLIIFFLIVGKLAADRQAEVRLPESAQGEEIKASSTLIINVMAGANGAVSPGAVNETGQWNVTVEGRGVSNAAELESLLRTRLAEAPGTVVQVRADRALRFGAVEPVLSACRRAGATGVQLAAEKTS